MARIVMSAVVLGLLLAAAPADAQCMVSSEGPVTVGVIVGVENDDAGELVMSRARVQVTLHASAPWTVRALGPVELEGRLVREHTHFAIAPNAWLPALPARLRTAAVVGVRVTARRPRRVDVDLDDAGHVRTVSGVPCRALIVFEPEVSDPRAQRGCVSSHERPRTHARLRPGAAIAHRPGGPAFARARAERSFEITPPHEGWVAITDIPGADPFCPSPFGFVRVQDVLELDLYDRAGVRLRLDRARDRYVVLSVRGRAAWSGARPGDEIVRIGRTEPHPHDGRPGHVAFALYEARSPVVVRREGVELVLAPRRDSARRRRRAQGEPAFDDF